MYLLGYNLSKIRLFNEKGIKLLQNLQVGARVDENTRQYRHSM
jgi:hypothetical protein